MKRQQKELSTISIFLYSGLIAAVLFGILWVMQSVLAPSGYVKVVSDETNILYIEGEEDVLPPQQKVQDAITPSFFVDNIGQAPSSILYYANLASGDAFFRNGRVTLQHTEKNNETLHYIGYDVVFEYPLDPIPVEKTETEMNHFYGDESFSNISTYKEIVYQGISEGVDLVYYVHNGLLKYDYRIDVGGNPEDINFSFDGVDTVVLSDDGDLLLSVGEREYVHDAPFTYQEIAGVQVEVESMYALNNDGVVSFVVGSYDDTYPLIIDPTLENLIASTYIGGSNSEILYDITLDSSGNVIAVGRIETTNFPVTGGAYDETDNGNRDVFVAKLNAALTSLSSATYLGGNLNDEPYAVIVDDSDAIYVAGVTHSTDFPTTAGAFDEIHNGNTVTFNDGFISKLSSDLSTLSYSTYFGGASSFDQIYDLAFHPSNGMLYAGGISYGGIYSNGNEYAPSDASGPNYDGFISIFSADLSQVASTTFLGSSGTDVLYQIEFDSSENVYAVGYTNGTDFPTSTSAYDVSQNLGKDVFVSALDENLESLLYSTYLGSSGDDEGYSIAIDSSGNIFVTGYTDSSGFPTTAGAYDETHNTGDDVFVSKFNAALTSLSASTFLGGSGADQARSMVLDENGYPYVTGYTASTNFPTSTSDAYAGANAGGNDVFVSKLSPSLDSLSESTYIGGTTSEQAESIVLNTSTNRIYIGAYGQNGNYPTTTGAYDTTVQSFEAYISAFDYALISASAPTAPGNLTVNTTSTTSVVFNYGAASTDDDFDQYQIFFKQAASGVTTTDTGFTSSSSPGDMNLANISYNSASTSTPLTGLATSTQYVVNIWAYDDSGFVVPAASEVAFYTLATPGGISVTSTDPRRIDITLSDNTNSASAVYAIYESSTGLYLNSGGSLASAVPVWQTTSTWGSPDPSVDVNTQYTFSVIARNGDGIQAATTTASPIYTLSYDAGTPVIGTPTTSTLPITVDANNNPSSTLFSLYNVTDGNYLDSDGTATSTAVYQTTSTWGGSFAAVGLTANTAYQFSSVARNGDDVASATSTASTATYTAANVPTGVSAIGGSQQVTVSWSGDGSEYYVTAGSGNSGWVSGTSATISSLSCGTEYAVTVKARNGDQVETASVAESASTNGCGGGGFIPPVVVTPPQTETVYGCTDPVASNFSSAATVDDGSCVYADEDILGCTNELAENYNSAATVDDGSCVYGDEDVVGCTDTSATNFNAAATIDDGSCLYEDTDVLGCTNAGATNYNAAATVDDGSCVYEDTDIVGCTDASAQNYNAAATVDNGACVYDTSCVGDECDTSSSCVGADCIVAGGDDSQTGGDVGGTIQSGLAVAKETVQAVKDVSFVTAETAKEIAELVKKTTKETVQKIVQLVDNPKVEKTNENVVAPVVVLAGAANVALGFSLPQMIALLRYFFSQPLLLLRRRKQKEWGVIYNSYTKRAVDLATIRVFDSTTGKIVRSQVTDSKGRYFLMLDPGKYRIEIDKTGFEKSSEFLHGKSEDSTYTNLYHAGEEVEVTEEQSALNVNIPLDPATEDKATKYIVKDHVKKAAQFAMSMIGLGVSAISFIISPNPMIGGLLGVHILFYAMFHVIAHKKQQGSVGVIRDASNEHTLKNVAVRIFDATYNKLIDTAVTDRKGRYAALVGPSTYYVTYDKVGYDKKKSKHIDFSSKTTEGLGGVIAENEELNPASGRALKGKSDDTPVVQQDNAKVESEVKDVVKKSGKIEKEDLDKLKEIAQYGGKDS